MRLCSSKAFGTKTGDRLNLAAGHSLSVPILEPECWIKILRFCSESSGKLLKLFWAMK